MREFGAGFGTLVRGFGFWRTAPRTMALGLIPAAIVGLVAVAGLVTLGIALPGLTDTLTPFADAWDPVFAGAVRVAIGVALLGGSILLVVVTFTAVTLVVGEPFYDRIWRRVEKETAGDVPDAGYGFWRAAGDGVGLIVRGVLAAIVAGAIGLIPVVGGVLGFVTGVVLTGWILADELSSRALSARGLGARERRMLRRGARARSLGFGVATQLCFLVPLGAVAVMPAAVAGSTLLAQDLLKRSRLSSATPSSPPPSPPANG